MYISCGVFDDGLFERITPEINDKIMYSLGREKEKKEDNSRQTANK